MKKVGLYFGTFNPIHIGHLIIANFMANHTELDEVWMVVTPHNPLKEGNNLLPDHHRLQMVKLAIKENMKLHVCDIEFDLPKPSFTFFTLRKLKEKHPEISFSLIMGEDNLRIFDRWKNHEEILSNHAIQVYPRISEDDFKDLPTDRFQGNIEICDAPLMKISSTFIRESIKNQKDVRYLIPEAVTNYISNNYLYEGDLNGNHI